MVAFKEFTVVFYYLIVIKVHRKAFDIFFIFDEERDRCEKNIVGVDYANLRWRHLKMNTMANIDRACFLSRTNGAGNDRKV